MLGRPSNGLGEDEDDNGKSRAPIKIIRAKEVLFSMSMLLRSDFSRRHDIVYV
jgi:hypothetical protein